MNMNISDKKVKEMLCNIRCQAVKCAAVSLVSEMLYKTLIAPRSSKVIVDKNVPAEIVAIGSNDGPTAVYVTTKKRRRINIVPAVACITVAGICHYLLTKKLYK